MLFGADFHPKRKAQGEGAVIAQRPPAKSGGKVAKMRRNANREKN
jgi:hypothetical protein